MQTKIRAGLIMAAATLAFATAALAQTAPPPAPPPGPPQFPNMSFFISSTGGPKGADFGGIAGADAHCQTLATKAGAGAKTWRAYLSVQAIGGATAVNARDRIGKGPWVNSAGVQVAANVDDLHSAKNKIDTAGGATETGRQIPGRMFVINQHDILTGSDENGRAPTPDKDLTCGNWTKSGDGSAMVGHHDRMGLNDQPPAKSWNASHPSRGCSHDQLKMSGGAGLVYCFAAN